MLSRLQFPVEVWPRVMIRCWIVVPGNDSTLNYDPDTITRWIVTRVMISLWIVTPVIIPRWIGTGTVSPRKIVTRVKNLPGSSFNVDSDPGQRKIHWILTRGRCSMEGWNYILQWHALRVRIAKRLVLILLDILSHVLFTGMQTAMLHCFDYPDKLYSSEVYIQVYKNYTCEQDRSCITIYIWNKKLLYTGFYTNIMDRTQ